MPSQPRQSAEGVVTKACSRSVAETVERLQRLIDEKALVLFAVIDHSGEAIRAGLEMPDTKLVIFGSPVAGTPVMVAEPLAALDLPLKLLVWADAQQTKVSYDSPAAIARRRGLSRELAANLTGINAVTDALVTP